MSARLPAACLWILLLSASASACGACRPSIRTLLFTPDFPARLAAMLAPVAILIVIGVMVNAYKENADAPP